jgi:hypothetical protein
MIEFIYTNATRVASIFPYGSTPYLIVLLIASSAIMVLIAVVGFKIIEFIFLRCFKLIVGRDFIFTQRMASLMCNGLAAIFICTYIFNLFQAIQTGETLTLEHRGGPSSHQIYWKDNKIEFVWTFVATAALMVGLWSLIKTHLLRAITIPDKHNDQAPSH